MAVPHIRTFKPRRRALSATRWEQLGRLGPEWCVEEEGDLFDAGATFGRSAPLVFDIGIGAGDSLIAMAVDEPDFDVIGADVHTPGIAGSLNQIEALGLTNVRLLHGDAVTFLARIPDSALAGVRIYFPDPWPKAKHRNRRIVSASIVASLVERLAPGGWIHLATDIDDYALQMERICSSEPTLHGGVVDRPRSRPITRYERKGLAAGRTITDLIYHHTP